MHGSALVLRNKSSSNFAGGSSSTFAAAPSTQFTEYCQLMTIFHTFGHIIGTLNITMPLTLCSHLFVGLDVPTYKA